MAIPVEKGTDNTILRTVSTPIRQITADIRKFADEMTKTMWKENGVGIAAPQCGRNIRMAIVRLNPGEKNEIIFPIINPEILERSEETEEGEEGCLSLPGVWGKVLRASRLTVSYKNLKNQEQTLVLEHFNARIIQHEVDHLDGVLFIDRAFEIEEKKRGKKSTTEQI
ncbi:MAG: peptide deformylase [Candidatus Gracilibacteria bacterium]|jgi:peptide deformylase